MADSIQNLINSFGNLNRPLESKDDAVVKLRAAGASAIPPLIEALEIWLFNVKQNDQAESDKRQEMTRLYAARTLGMMGKPAAKAAPALADLFAKSRISLLRREAAIALSRIGPVPDAATNADILYLMTTALSGSRDHSQEDVREAAAIALGALGSAAKNAVPMLMSCLMDRSERIRNAAFHALVKLAPASVPLMMDALQSRARIRADLLANGTLVFGAWAMDFSPSQSNPESAKGNRGPSAQRQEECMLLEKIFESGVQILTKLNLASADCRAILTELVQADANPKLRTLAKDALDKVQPSGAKR